MAKKLYNLPLLGDAQMRDDALGLFLDTYATSLDVDPVCRSMTRKKSAEALWDDFVRISSDLNRAVAKRLK